jgi:hypothetical protein
MLILYYNTLWGEPLRRAALPDGFEITTDRTRYRDARVVVFHIPEWKWVPRFLLPQKLPQQLWVAWSMECEENYPRLQDPAFMRRFDVTMTYRLDSDVPVPYFSYFGTPPGLFAALQTPPYEKTARAPAVLFISSRINQSGRREYARELMRYLQTDSYGKFMRSARLPNDRGRPSKLETLRYYKFTLAFENAIAPDYVTEKFYDPLIAGSVPIYLGAPNVETFAPGDHCYINVNDFASPHALAEYLHFLLRDQDAYNAYFAWKQKPLRPAFVAQVKAYAESPQTRLCKWLDEHYAHRIAFDGHTILRA